MNAYTYGLVALALVLASALAAIGTELPEPAWAAVGLALGAAIKRPGDVSADELARELESTEQGGPGAQPWTGR